MTTGFSAQILRVAYIRTSVFAAAIGGTWKQGDLIADSDIASVIGFLTWQELAINNDITAFKFITEPLTEAQYGDKVRGDISQKGFENPEGVITRPLDSIASTTHEDIFASGLGKKVASSGNSDTIAAAGRNLETVTVTTGGVIVSGDIGKFISIGNNKSILLDVIGSNLVLASRINVEIGDVCTIEDHFNPDELEDYDFIMFVETAKGNHLVSWVRFGVDFASPPNELFKLMLNWQGDVAPKSTLTWDTIGTVTAEAQSKAMETSNFTGISLVDSNVVCVNAFDFKLTREMTRIPCQGTESQQGNGGTDKKKYSAKVEVTAYADVLEDIYAANGYFPIVAQKKNLAIYAPGALVNSEDVNTVSENQHTTKYMIDANVDMSKSMMISL